ncbi:transcriptional activator XlnR [Aspergillus sclerotialis]|uniref:Transcriptional activator XlnR n=1 Tax=Aspergillus sclerotialis TaxID=2070753 RepID=A0A3A2ZLM0_9EURO|nr:transcriptional activator XlnR [Aspergillus sclerotialis]
MGPEPVEASDRSPRDTTTSNNAPPQDLPSIPGASISGLLSHSEGEAAPAETPGRDTDFGSSVNRLHPQFPNNLADAETPKQSQTAISSLINPAFTLDELYPGPIDVTGGPSFEPRHPSMTTGHVQHWLEKTPSLPSAGSLTGLPQNALDGDVRGGHTGGIPILLKYRCLEPVLPHLRGILSAEDASEMLEIYFNEQRTSLFKSTSPYALTHVLHPWSVLHPTDPRPTSPTLLVVILFCVAQTADMKIFDPPGARQRIIVDLYRLSLDLIQPEDADSYFRTSDGWQFYNPSCKNNTHPTTTRHVAAKNLLPEALGSTDVILAVAILTLVISGGHYKADSLKWLSKLIRLVRASGLSLEDQDDDFSSGPGGFHNGHSSLRRWVIYKEERRRLFWMVYCLDRHLALSFNLPLSIQDGTFCVRAPLPERVWQSLDTADLDSIPVCSLGPQTRITGSGFFEYFLPLASILGHIIDLHHCRYHPFLGEFVSRDAIGRIEAMITQRQQELAELDNQASTFYDIFGKPSNAHTFSQKPNSGAGHSAGPFTSQITATTSSSASKLPLVKAYSTYLLHVFYILLYGKWDPISMIEDNDDWITSEHFMTCASHALSATGVLSQILTVDPELTFMPYLFGIYLLQGSFIFLLFVDRMPELGPNRSVEEVCETIIRAHEVCVVTLDTTFQVRPDHSSSHLPYSRRSNFGPQKNIRKVFRSMLHDAQQAGSHSWDEHKTRRRELLSLYRWTPLTNGLAY